MTRRKTIAESEKDRAKPAARRQLIGEEIGPARVRPARLFKTELDAEMSDERRSHGGRSRLVTIGSAAWMRALDAELKIASDEKIGNARQ